MSIWFEMWITLVSSPARRMNTPAMKRVRAVMLWMDGRVERMALPVIAKAEKVIPSVVRAAPVNVFILFM